MDRAQGITNGGPHFIPLVDSARPAQPISGGGSGSKSTSAKIRSTQKEVEEQTEEVRGVGVGGEEKKEEEG